MSSKKKLGPMNKKDGLSRLCRTRGSGAERASYDDRRAEAVEDREGKPQRQGHH
jgi:hypothetical protein